MTARRSKLGSHLLLSFAILLVGSLGLWASFAVWPNAHYYDPALLAQGGQPGSAVPLVPSAPPKPKHLPTPEPVKGIYMSSWVAGTQDFRNSLIKLIDETELNSVVIDIKDYTGKISFEATDPELAKFGSGEKRIADIHELINLLHEKNIYVIGRIAVFQDPFLTAQKPELAVKRADGTTVWTDHKGAKWLDPASREAWDYIVLIARESERLGFDELNFDYIRFPSDGNMKDISYPFFDKTKLTKSASMNEFFVYLREKLGDLKIPLSADFFGMTTTNADDLNIGQLLENGLANFDYIAPMVYPSHYPPTFLGYKNPAAYPYEVVKYAMDEGVKRAVAMGQDKSKLRPWLQDFDLGAPYTAEMIKKQMQATYDAGLTSWLLWSPSNKYTRGALED